MRDFVIRLFQPEDAEAVSRLIVHTQRTTNRKDYSAAYIEADAAKFTPGDVLFRASWTHFYVACADSEIIGCGAIGPYWGKEDESSLFNIFVHPDWQGKGVGRRIMETLEQDDYFLRAKRIEIPASVIDIAEDAFAGCGALEIAAPEGSDAAQYAAAHGFAQ